MMRRLGVFGSAAALLASAFVAVTTFGVSPARADSFGDWAGVSAGQYHSCGVRKNGKLYCWGGDENGQIGDGDGSTPHNAPVRVGAFEDWATVSAGGYHSCGVRKNGKLYCWGDDHDGEVGDGPGNPEVVAAPVRVGTFEDWAKVSAGREHTCGVRENGKLYCWGLDEDGQVGDGVVNDFRVLAPRRIGTFEDWATVGAGDNHTCGVRRNGKLYCWGSNTQGKIGVGSDDFDPVLAPVRVGTFEDWASVSGGGGHTCGVRRNGKLYCWGYDGTGQLGDGDGSAPHNAPVRIGAFEDWATVSAGREHTCGVRRNGKLYCWGLDDFGRVGDGDGDAPHNAPVRIGAFEDWADGSAGSYHSCGVRKIGKLYCWGDDEFGQVGDGADEVADLAPRRI